MHRRLDVQNHKNYSKITQTYTDKQKEEDKNNVFRQFNLGISGIMLRKAQKSSRR